MATIEVDESTKKDLETLAASSGLTLEGFLRSISRGTAPARQSSDARFESELDELTHNGPAIPEELSRADIYSDHD